VVRVVAVANQKGGVGKTTTAINVAASIALSGERVLLVDMDPQGNATSGLGVDHRRVEAGVYELLLEGAPLARACRQTTVPNLTLVPAGPDLAGAEVELIAVDGREGLLRKALGGAVERYGLVLIDCPPSLGLLTVNALVAADAVLIPIQCEYFALEGVSQLLSVVQRVRQGFNPHLLILGVVLTMLDARANLCWQVAEEVKRAFRGKVFRSAVPRNVRLSEAPSHGLPIGLYDARSRGAEVYADVAKEVLVRARGAAAAGTGA
jgi:chromosome partitioning protein